jgi:predicted RNA-binding protein with PIN domain
MTRARETSEAVVRPAPVVLVDARNVQRSVWPNIASEQLVERVREWARGEAVRPVVVFDGRAPGEVVGELELDDGSLLVGTAATSADDWIADAASACRRAGAPFWLVTSDRELRARAGRGAERTIGGGTLARALAGRR